MESKTYLNLFPPQGGVFSCCSPQRIITRQNLDHQKYCSIPFGAYVQATYSNTKTNDQLPRTLDCIYLRHSPNTKDGHQSLHLPTGHVITRAWSSYPCSHHPKWDWSGAWSCHPRWHGYEDKDEPQLHRWHTISCGHSADDTRMTHRFLLIFLQMTHRFLQTILQLIHNYRTIQQKRSSESDDEERKSHHVTRTEEEASKSYGPYWIIVRIDCESPHQQAYV